MAVVTMSAVSKAFTRGKSRVTVLDRLHLSIEPGEVVVVRGRSGSGKTTLLNLLAGWQSPDAGTIRWGIDRPQSWDRVAVVPQSLGLLPELTLGENITLPGRLSGEADDAGPVASRLEIGHLLERAPDHASLGEQQRAAIARALVMSPALVLADEPSSHQDLDRLHLVWRLLDQAAASGTAVLAATHDPDALPYAHRVLNLQAGRLEPAA